MTSPDPNLARADPIIAARERNERTITWVVLGVVGVGIGVAGWRTLTVEATQGIRILVYALLVAGFYAAGLARKGPPSRQMVWVRVTVEVSSATVVMLLDALAGSSFLVSSATTMLYPLAILVAALRLVPRITLYATMLAISQHVALCLYIFNAPSMQFGAGGFSEARMYQELVFRVTVMAMMGGLGAYVMVTLRREIANAADEERVRTAFGHYVDRSVVRRVLAGDLRIAPERRDVTVLFVDIRDFTRLSENRDAADVFRLLSGTLDAFSQEVQKQGGIVNKYLGDGLLAIFGAPENQPDHARRAVRCALNIVAEARARALDGRFPGLRVGVGIHGGPVVVGDLGGERREFTAIGDVVNVASRVEAANKDLGTTILVTRFVVENLGSGAVARSLPPITLRGREAPVEVYELTDLEAAELSYSALRPAS